MPRTNIVNAVDVELAVAVAAPDLTITVDDAVPLPPVPFYLVVDPFNDTQGREYMLCTLVAVNVLTVTRNLEGTDSQIHDVGDVVRITIAAQHIGDLWTDIEAIPPQTFLHADLTDVGSLPSVHHPRYIDTEAVDAMGVIGDGNPLNHPRYTDVEALIQANTLDHDHATPIEAHRAGAGAHHDRYLDAEAIAAVGPHTDPQTFLHADLTDVGSLPSAHHAKYLDSEAVAANTGLWLPLGGGTLSGFLTLHADPTALLHASTKQYVDANHIIGAEPISPKIGDIWVDPSAIGEGLFLPLAGGIMTGFITLHADPTAALHAATKQYVDALPVGIPEAPNDGQQYGRQSLTWSVVTHPPPGIGEAPVNGLAYVRQDATWIEGIRKTGDTMSGILTFLIGTNYVGYNPGNPFEFQGRNVQVTDSGSEPGAIGKVGDIVLNYGGGTPQGVWIRSSFGGNANNWHHIAGRFL